MNEKKYIEMAHLYPYGLLTRGEREQLLVHIEHCNSCRRIVRKGEALRDRLASGCKVATPDGLNARIRANLLREGSIVQRGIDWVSVYLMSRKLIPAAACVAIMLFLATLLVAPGKAYSGTGELAFQSVTPSRYFIAHSLPPGERALLSSKSDLAVAGYYDQFGIMNDTEKSQR